MLWCRRNRILRKITGIKFLRQICRARLRKKLIDFYRDQCITVGNNDGSCYERIKLHSRRLSETSNYVITAAVITAACVARQRAGAL